MKAIIGKYRWFDNQAKAGEFNFSHKLGNGTVAVNVGNGPLWSGQQVYWDKKPDLSQSLTALAEDDIIKEARKKALETYITG